MSSANAVDNFIRLLISFRIFGFVYNCIFHASRIYRKQLLYNAEQANLINLKIGEPQATGYIE